MSELLADYVHENYARVVHLDLRAWLSANELPCICDCYYGGMRIFLFKSGENVVIVSKSGGLYTPASSPKVFSNVTEFVHAPHRMILDGEYLAGEGIRLFDVIQIDNRDIRRESLEKRREILDEIIEGMNLSTRSCLVNRAEQIAKFRDNCVSSGYEGAIVKNPKSRYGERGRWLEFNRADTLCCFVTDVETVAKQPVSWTLGLVDDNRGKLINLGKVTTVSEKIKRRSITVGSVVEVRFQRVKEASLVDPFIIRLRTDKPPSECVLSQLDTALKIPELS